MIRSVPKTSGNTPNTVGVIFGLNRVPRMNCENVTSSKKPIAGSANERMMPTVVRTDNTAQARNTSLYTRSR